jgi:hypothetical protein
MIRYFSINYDHLSEVESILDVVTKLLFLVQALLEMVYLLGQEVVHLELLLHHILQFVNIRVNIEVHVPHTLNLGYQLTLLSQQLGVLFDGSHVSGKDLLLLFKNVRDLFLECKILFTDVVIFEGRLHDIDVFLRLFLVDFIHLSMNFFFHFFIKFFVLFLAVDSITLSISLFFLRLVDKGEIRLLLLC